MLNLDLPTRSSQPTSDQARDMSEWTIVDARHSGYKSKWSLPSGKRAMMNFIEVLRCRRTRSGEEVCFPMELAMDLAAHSEFRMFLAAANIVPASKILSGIDYKAACEAIGAAFREHCPTVFIQFGPRKGGRSKGIVFARPGKESSNRESWMRWPNDNVVDFKSSQNQ